MSEELEHKGTPDLGAGKESKNITNISSNETSKTEDEKLKPMLKIVADNHGVIEELSSGQGDPVAKVGELAEKLGPEVSKLLDNPKIKNMIETFTSVDNNKSGSFIGEALEVINSKNKLVQKQTLTASISRLQTIFKDTDSMGRELKLNTNNNDITPVINIAKTFLEMSKRKHS